MLRGRRQRTITGVAVLAAGGLVLTGCGASGGNGANGDASPAIVWGSQSERTVDVPSIMDAVVMSIVPILALCIFGRRQLVASLSAGIGR